MGRQRLRGHSTVPDRARENSAQGASSLVFQSRAATRLAPEQTQAERDSAASFAEADETARFGHQFANIPTYSPNIAQAAQNQFVQREPEPETAPPTPVTSAETTETPFEVGDETHRLWIEEVDGQTVVMIASDPVTVPQQLLKWSKEAARMQDSPLKTNILAWITKCWSKLEQLNKASAEVDPALRAGKIHDASANLKEMIKRLFWAFKIDLPELGAVAVYRGIHFSKDWQEKRGRTVEAESQRSFEEIKAEGSYSSATYELAKGIARDKPVTSLHLEAANRLVMEVLEQWKQTTDFTREDESKVGSTAIKKRESLQKGITNFLVTNPAQAQLLQQQLDQQKQAFTQSGFKFPNQFMAALSRYIDNQKTFEAELPGEMKAVNPHTRVETMEKTAYTDVPFSSIPFISTSKDAGEAVKYAQGKLASEENKSTAGIVGRVLVYVAHRIDLLEAGGIDVWEELGNGRLQFTEWRMNENEITFSGKMPDHFLRAMTPVTGEGSVADNANLAEVEAAKAAAPFGGLKPLPKNKAQ